MSTVVGPRTYVAPNGVTRVNVYPHGAVAFVGEVDEKTQGLVQEMSGIAAGMLPEDATPYEAFELMGWKLE